MGNHGMRFAPVLAVVTLACALAADGAALRSQAQSEDGRLMFYDAMKRDKPGVYANVLEHMENMIAKAEAQIEAVRAVPASSAERLERVLNSRDMTQWSTLCAEGGSFLRRITAVAERLAENPGMEEVLAHMAEVDRRKEVVCQHLLDEIAYATRLARDYHVTYPTGSGADRTMVSERLLDHGAAVAKRETPDYIIVPGCVDPKESVLRAQYALDYWLMLPEEARAKCYFVMSGMGFWKTEGAADQDTAATRLHLAFMRRHTRVKDVLSDEDKEGLDASAVEDTTEAAFMREVILKTLQERGSDVEIPDSHFIMDEEARDTVGNAVFSLLEIMKHYVRTHEDPSEALASIPHFLRTRKNVVLVSSTYHIIRAHDFYARVFPLHWNLDMNSVTVTDQWARDSDDENMQVCRLDKGRDLGAMNCASSVSLSIQQNFLVDDKMEARYRWMDHVPVPEMLMHLTKNHPLYNGYHAWAANHGEFMALLNPPDVPEDKSPLMKIAKGKQMWPEPITWARDKVGEALLGYYLGEDRYGPVVAAHWASTFKTSDNPYYGPGMGAPAGAEPGRRDTDRSPVVTPAVHPRVSPDDIDD